MKALPIIIFLLSVNLLSVAAAEYVTEEFKFEQTITIYHMINDSGIIYLRPDKYDENQGFIKIFEAMDQYLTELQQSEREAFLPPADLPLTGELVFVNGVAEKQYFLKEGWLGDGENWVPMNERHYKTLSSFINGRRDAPGSATAAAELAAFTATLRDANQNGIPDFEAQFGRSRTQWSLTVASASEDKTTIHNNADVEHNDGSPESLSTPIPAIITKAEEDEVRPANVQRARTAFIRTTTKLSPDDHVVREHSNQAAPSEVSQSDVDSQPPRTWPRNILLILLVGWLLYFLRKRIWRS
jgi:hypothetical protein